MRPNFDPFFSRLLMALALYAVLVVLWMHTPSLPPASVQAPSATISHH